MNRLADQIMPLLEAAMDETERLVRLELQRVGLGLNRWLATFWQRVPYDDWLSEIEQIFTNLQQDQVFVDEESRRAFIAWLAAMNAAAKQRVEQIEREAEALARDEDAVLLPIPRRMPPEIEKLLREILAEIEKKPRDQWLQEVRELLDRLDLPPQVEADLLAYYAQLHDRLVYVWNLLWKSPGPRAGPPEAIPDVIFRVLAGLDKFIAEGRLDELLDALRELVRRMPELIPPGARGGEIEDLVGELREVMHKFLDLLEALPPEAAGLAIELLQLSLDIAGMIPGGGEPFDLLSAIISARRGEWLDVGISVLSTALVFGMALGVGKIFARLKKLAALVARLKGPARKILTNLIEALTRELKSIPIDSVRGAIDGIRRFIKRLGKLLEDVIGRLRKTTKRREKRSGVGQNAPESGKPRTKPSGKPYEPPSSLFGGKTFQEWGREVIKWSSGEAGAAARAARITIEELRANGVTREQAQAVLDFYLAVFAENKHNAAALARAKLMKRILELLGGS